MSTANLARKNYIEELHRLSKSNPGAWGNFLKAFEVYVSEQCEQAVRSSSVEALAAHGRAQAFIAIRDEFREIEHTFSKFQPNKS